ncbi:growth hormone secretagogue receptor type 1-like [Octopus vulgaris]|uniref:Growth hormone secretagogue receptor type 1-like n=1 Tax=Octopus vulgaris TaxID=6645 RepID=A0AA36BB41_OCTVU|nr:growth hormone secretagogue receptor type 1-like [Octopus vulgaris]
MDIHTMDTKCNMTVTYSDWTLEQYILSVIISLYALVGTVGNVLILIVYLKKQDRKSSSTFIRVLALLDLCVCMFVMPYTIVYELRGVTSDAICHSFEVVRHFCIMASNASLVAIALERCVAVRRPTRRLSLSQVNKGMIVIVVISVVLAIPSVFIFAVVPGPYKINSGNCTEDIINTRNPPFCHFTMSYLGEIGTRSYQALLSMSYGLACFSIVVLYTLIYTKLWKKAQLRKKLSNPLGIPTSSSSSNSSSDRSTPSVGTEKKKYFDEMSDSTGCTLNNARKLTPSVDSDVDSGVQSPTPPLSSNGDRKSTKGNESCKTHGKFSDKRRSMHHNRTAKMLFLCTIIYIVAWVPFWLDIFSITNSLILRYLFLVGNASNPIVYGIVNDRVREEVCKLFRRRKRSGYP